MIKPVKIKFLVDSSINYDPRSPFAGTVEGLPPAVHQQTLLHRAHHLEDICSIQRAGLLKPLHLFRGRERTHRTSGAALRQGARDADGWSRGAQVMPKRVTPTAEQRRKLIFEISLHYLGGGTRFGLACKMPKLLERLEAGKRRYRHTLRGFKQGAAEFAAAVCR
jgi:hypothetical protein